MDIPTSKTWATAKWKPFQEYDLFFLLLSILIQLVLAFFFGHIYDVRIFMATGYLVGTGQNPYIAQDLSAVFQNPAFQGLTSFGYPPAWSLVLGLIYRATYRIIPNFLLYNLAIKLPVIAANICLAYLVVNILGRLGTSDNILRKAWIFLLFNPFLLCTTSAWGQFDSVVALLVLLSLDLLSQQKVITAAALLALAVSLKPIAMPVIPVVFIYLAGISLRRTVQYFSIFSLSMVLFCVVPFLLFGWDPTPIFQHWNAHFTVGGGLSFMTFLEYLQGSYQLTGLWWLTGWFWVPALCIVTVVIKPRIKSFKDLLKFSIVLIMVFYLCRAWTSETNINLVLPLVLILCSIDELVPRSLTALWVLPLLFSLFNTSIAQLFFPSLPGVMNYLIELSTEYSTTRYVIRTMIVLVWLAAGWWIVFSCFKNRTSQVLDGIQIKRMSRLD